jgi:hypothetical protein
MEDAAWDVEVVACLVDMKATDCSRSFVQREESWEGERLDKDSRSELMAVSTMQTAQSRKRGTQVTGDHVPIASTVVGVSCSKRYGIIGSKHWRAFLRRKHHCNVLYHRFDRQSLRRLVFEELRSDLHTSLHIKHWLSSCSCLRLPSSR